MARYKKLATILRDVDYKKPYKPTKPNTEMFFNILNYATIKASYLKNVFSRCIYFRRKTI